MSKYLTLIPLLREMCFPYYHSCLEKKMTMILGNWNFYVFSFGNWANVIWVMNMKPRILLFQRRSSSPFIPFHLSSSKYFLSIPFSLYGRLYVNIPCGESRLDLSSMFFYLFYIYFCLYGEAGSIDSPSCHVCLVSLFLHSKHTPPSIFLFFLNVIVKCSSEMTLNMCTLTEGIHLVIYFLLPVLRGLFIVSFSLNQIRVFGQL